MRIETIGNATLYLGDCRDILPALPKVDWHDLPTEPGLWLVHAKGSRTDVMACTIVTDEMMACIDEAIDADIDYCGPYALPPDTKEEK